MARELQSSIPCYHISNLEYCYLLLQRTAERGDTVRSSAGMPPPGARARSINHTCITDSTVYAGGKAPPNV